MIRLFLYTLVRFFIFAFAIYLGLTILRWIIRLLQGQPHRSFRTTETKDSPRAKEDYKDVQEAEFEELTDNQKKEKK